MPDNTGATPVKDPQTAQYERDKAAAEARTALANATVAEQKAAFGSISGSGLTGGVSVTTGAGNSEATLSAALAIEEIAKHVRDAIKDTTKSKTVYIFAGTQKIALGAWRGFALQREIVGKALDYASGYLEQALSPPDGGQRAALVPGATPAPGAASPARIAPVAAVVTGVGAALDIASKVTSFFQSDYAAAGSTVTGLDDDLLASAVCAGLDDAFYPSRYEPVAASLAEIDALLGDLPDQASELDGQVLEAQARSAAIDAAKAANPQQPQDPRDAALGAALQSAIALGAEAQKSYAALLTGLAATGSDGLPAVLAILAEQKRDDILQKKGGFVLSVSLKASTGANYTKKTLWTTLWNSIPFFVSGGAVASFILMNGADGKILKSGLVVKQGGYRSVDTVMKS